MALINKLKAIANAIRSKTNKSEELTLEQMASEVEDIDTLQGLDFEGVFDQGQAEELNQHYKDGIAYAKEIIVKSYQGDDKVVYVGDIFKPNVAYGFFRNFYNCHNLQLFAPNSTILSDNACQLLFGNCGSLRRVATFDFSPYSGSINQIFANCFALDNVTLLNIDKISSFSAIFSLCYSLVTLRLTKWKQANISLNQASKLSAESIKYIIWHAFNGENTLGFENQGATSRTLQLHATPYESWDTWKLTKPSVEDCEFLGISEEEITKYGELTWEDIALNVKLITIAK